VGCYVFNLFTKEPATSVSKIYLFEAIGSGIASFLFSLFLIRILDNFVLVTLISGTSLVAAFSMLLSTPFSSRSSKFIFIPLIVTLGIVVTSNSKRLDDYSLKRQWQNYEILDDETTIYGHITVAKLQENISFFENGFLMFTYPDLFYAEEAVHFALLEHPAPESVLLIGGGVGGSLEQVLTHPQVRRLDYVQLDPEIINLAIKHLPEKKSSVLSDERFHVHYTDGRIFVKNTTHKYDVVIINLPDPHTTLINRFYTLEFFQRVKRILNTGGIAAFSVTSSENVIGDELAIFLRSLLTTLQQVFPDVILIPGDTNHFISCKSPDILTTNPEILISRMQSRKLETMYVREYYIPFRMSPDRTEYLRQRLSEIRNRELNRDFKPVGNFYHLIVWTTYFNQTAKNIFLIAERIGFKGIIMLSVLLFLPFLLLLKHRMNTKMTYGIISSIAVVGFSEMALEIIIIHAFQAIYGYVYFQLALILSSFMIGLAAGSFFGIRHARKSTHVFPTFTRFQFAMTAYPLFLLAILIFLKHFMFHFIIIQILFFGLTLSAGFIAGFQYPLASHLYYRMYSIKNKSAGNIYAFDLAGACLGAIITSSLLIPILGIKVSLAAICLFNLMIWLGLRMSGKQVEKLDV
ncbi:hypothetical protein GF337_12600, partial [candidate division KSB1 bacterium]|nr:hypothetical protein [candidate division KSB1 bacterium]